MAFYEQKHGFDADYYTVEENQDFSFPKHVHRCLELVTVDEGQMVITIEDKDWTLSAGDCILIWSAQVHSLRTEGHSHHRLCIFSPELVRRFFALHEGQLPLCPVIRGKDAQLCRQMISHLQEEGDIFHVKGILYVLAGELERCITFHKRAHGRHEDGSVLMSQMLAYMNEHFTGDCTISHMAAELCYEKSYLSKFFSKTVGISPAEYLLQLRLSKACELLVSTKDNVITVGTASGFNSLRTFNRNFMERYGMTPTEFRASHAGKLLVSKAFRN